MQPNIKIIIPYHNNLADSVRALQSIGKAEVLSPKSFNRVIYDTDGVHIRKIPSISLPIFGRQYIPAQLHQHIAGATHIMIKHLHVPDNIVPFLLAMNRHLKVIVLVQRTGPAAHYLMQHPGRRVAVTNAVCVDPARFPTAAHPHTADKLRLLTIAKFQSRKHLPALVRAVGFLVAHYPGIEITLDIVGVVGSRTELLRVTRLIHQLGITPNVHIHHEVPHKKVMQHFTESDLFILPASREPLGYSVLEAMASGLPAIVSEEAGAAQAVSSEKNGFIIPAGNSEAIQRAVSYFISSGLVNHQRIAEFGTAARHTIINQYSPNAFLKRFQPLL